MDDLVQFLRDRLDEDEVAATTAAGHAAGVIAAKARKAGRFDPPYRGTRWGNDYDHVFALDGREGQPRMVEIADCGHGAFQLTPHIARHDPTRVLAEVEAKRRILDEIVPAASAVQEGLAFEYGQKVRQPLEMDLLGLLAMPYSDHPDYRPEWRPPVSST